MISETILNWRPTTHLSQAHPKTVSNQLQTNKYPWEVHSKPQIKPTLVSDSIPTATVFRLNAWPVKIKQLMISLSSSIITPTLSFWAKTNTHLNKEESFQVLLEMPFLKANMLWMQVF